MLICLYDIFHGSITEGVEGDEVEMIKNEEDLLDFFLSKFSVNNSRK